MVDLFEELADINQVTEDHFIFLNKQGQIELKQKIYFSWVDFPSKHILIICSPSDSLSYIKALICVSLEKYPIFSGIKSLKISSLFSSKEELKEKGTIGEYLKPEEKFSFKVTSTEIWLDVQLDLRDLLSMVFFQIKVSIETQLLTIRKILTDILNSVLKFQNTEGHYKEENIILQSIQLSEEEFSTYDLKGMMLNKYSKVRSVNKIEYEHSVKDHFCIKEHFLLCVPPGKMIGNGKIKKSTLREIYRSGFLHVLKNGDFGVAIRNASFEAKGLGIKRQVSGQIQRKVSLDERKSQACNCLII